jgi:mannose/fructose-specific phosphotransferase system component IIA
VLVGLAAIKAFARTLSACLCALWAAGVSLPTPISLSSKLERQNEVLVESIMVQLVAELKKRGVSACAAQQKEQRSSNKATQHHTHIFRIIVVIILY